MTTDKAKKQAVRVRMAQTGESYTEALRHVEDERTLPSGSTPAVDRCANCDAELAMENQGLFCSEFCKQLAEHVRYARKVVRDPVRSADPEVQYALKIRMAHLLSGGYPEQDRRLTAAQRAAVIERDQELCRRCGNPGMEIDHIAGSSDDPANLQLLCRDCHKEKTTAVLQPASPEQQAWASDLYEDRILVETPARLCDDETRWATEWRALKNRRIDHLWEQLEDETSFSRSDYRGWKWVDAVGDAYDSNVLPGEDLADVWDDIDPGGGTRVGTEEEMEEALYLRDVMEKDD